MSGIRLIVGLGNPDAQYEGTRHNAGAFFVRQLAKPVQHPLSQDKNAVGEIGRGLVAGHDLRLLIPSTYMNHSGRSVAGTAHYYRIDPSDMLIAHDELDIEPGEARFKRDGGHGGHNGLRTSFPLWEANVTSGGSALASVIPGSAAKQVSSWVLSKASAADSRLAIEASTEVCYRCAATAP